MSTLEWVDGALEMIDQTLLPNETRILRVSTVSDLVGAIQRLSVRGAPAIGVAGAYGVVIAASQYDPLTDSNGFEAAVAELRGARPTAVNLTLMVDRVAAVARNSAPAALAEAHAIRAEELNASIRMGLNGAGLLRALVDRQMIRVMTICNTGGLASVERGTALAVVQAIHERGSLEMAFALETRPLLQGARLTTWELEKMGAPYHLIADSAGPFLLSRGEVDAVLIGADRIAANGDTANKIGSFSLALGAAHAGVPFVVVAPESTVDLATASGDAIEIENRDASEVTSFAGVRTAVAGARARNPAFDITPAGLITAIVTDRRVIDIKGGETPGWDATRAG